jgi:hypothetical protein
MQMLLASLQTQGYVEAAQVLWGSAGSDVPFNWEKDGQLSLVEGLAPPEEQLASFQVRILMCKLWVCLDRLHCSVARTQLLSVDLSSV